MRHICLLLLILQPACLSATDVRNILLIVSDDLKASVLGCYGDKFCKTPNIAFRVRSLRETARKRFSTDANRFSAPWVAWQSPVARLDGWHGKEQIS